MGYPTFFINDVIMNAKQKEAIETLYLRDKHSLPRIGLRLTPMLERRGEENPLSGMEDIEKFIKLNKDVFISLFSIDQIDSKEYDCIFLDIDDPIPRMAFIKLLTVCDTLKRNGIMKYTILKSGSKGYHVYVRFKTVMLSNYRQCVLNWLKSVKLNEIVDVAAVETKRVTRIPYSNNGKGTQCIPIGNDELSLSLIPKEAELVVETNDNFHTALKKFDESEVRAKGLIMDGESKLFNKREFFPECMGMLVDEALSGTDLGHHERFEMGKFLLHVHGGDINKVAKYYSKMSDYKPRTTKYQLNHIIIRNYKMSNCKNLRNNGMCPMANQSDCPFAPSLNHFMREDK